MSQLNLRKKARLSYYEIEEPNIDEYIYCSDCRDYVFEYCSIHGPLLVIPDNKVPAKTNFPSFVPRAALTIPGVFLHLAHSTIPDAGLGVFTTLTLPKNVRFGPYRGNITHTAASNYCWQIYDKNNKPSHMIDASNANKSNWMRYVNCSRHWCEQNLVAFQYRGHIYYRTIKTIPRFTELMVFYGIEFANKLKIDFRRYHKPLLPTANSQKKAIEKSKEEAITVIECKNNENIVPVNSKCEDANPSVSNNKAKQVKNKLKSQRNGTKIHKRKENKTKVKKTKDKNNNALKNSENLKTNLHEIKTEIESQNEQGINYTENKSLSINNMFYCDKCPYRGITRYKNSHLQMHALKNFDKEVFTCDICHFICQNKQLLEKHGKRHTGDLYCNLCNICFCKKKILSIHNKIHTGEKSYICSICNKAFTEKYNLTRHIRIHTGEKSYICSICNKAFTEKYKLTQHIRIHTGEKSYICSICNKAFTEKSNLTQHIRIHTGEKSYICNICKKAFMNKSNLTRHIRTHKCRL